MKQWKFIKTKMLLSWFLIERSKMLPLIECNMQMMKMKTVNLQNLIINSLEISVF